MTGGGRVTGGSKIWTVRGIPPELQSQVSTAAKAARQTLGEWTAAALQTALKGGERDEVAKDLRSGRFDDIEAHIAVLERRLDTHDTRADGTLSRVDGVERQLAMLRQRLDYVEVSVSRPPPPPPPPPPPSPPPSPSTPEAAAALAEPSPHAGPFTRGIGSRKRLTVSGEEELQRLLAAGVDDATIAARLGIHKRIVWARRLTDRAD